MKKLIGILFVIAFLISFKPTAVLFSTSMTGTDKTFGGRLNNQQNCNAPNDLQFCHPDSVGIASLRMRVFKGQTLCSGNYRTEIGTIRFDADMAVAEWFHFEFVFPTYQAYDPVPMAICQYPSGNQNTYQMNPLTGLAVIEGGKKKVQASPLWALHFEGSKMEFVQNFAYRNSTHPNPDTAQTQVKHTLLSNFVKGKKYALTIQFKKSMESNGVLNVWLDGVQVLNLTGPNADIMKPGDGYGYFKFGPYVWRMLESVNNERIMFFTKVAYGNASCTISDFITAPPLPNQGFPIPFQINTNN